ncbi:MAG: CaiB/BaiF CoA-transferase family protein [Vulcanimicrobiaceae bacterium]
MGPLRGTRVIEFGGIGPGPFCAMMLADMGADVLRLERAGAPNLGLSNDAERRFRILHRGRPSIGLDLKTPSGSEAALRLVSGAHAIVEGFRPGVMERLGLGPADCLRRNPSLVYGRVTGWGQDGPLAQSAGHDINYIALSGALHAIGTADAPLPPLNLIGDFGGGALYLAFGIACALIEAGRSGCGQVVDAAMVDGAASLMAGIYGMHATGAWRDARGENYLDGGAPWYSVYATKDGKHVAIGTIEAGFYRELLEKLELRHDDLPAQFDRARWPELRAAFARVFSSKTRAEWCSILEGSDACFAPVLSLGEAPHHAHLAARGTFVQHDGVTQPAPAPRFSRTRPKIRVTREAAEGDSAQALLEWGFSASEIASLQREHVLL